MGAGRPVPSSGGKEWMAIEELEKTGQGAVEKSEEKGEWM